MSFNFWFNLVLALLLFGLAVLTVQAYKSEMLRGFRARFLRRRIVPVTQTIMSQLLVSARSDAAGTTLLGGSYELMRARADLESLYRRSKPLFQQERQGIALFLEGLSKVSRQMEQQQNSRQDLEETVLRGQRVVHELTELGL